MTHSNHPTREPPGASLRWGFVLVGLVDAALALTLLRGPRMAVATLALQVAYSFGHILLCGFVVGALADAGQRVVPHRPLFRALAAWAAATVAFFFILGEDYSVFELYVRLPLTLASALPYGALAGVAPFFARRRVVGGACLGAAVALATANGFVLLDAYHGIHLAITLAAGMLAGLGTSSIAPRRLFARGRVEAVGWGIAALGVSATVAIRPSNKVGFALARHPTASVMAFVSHARNRPASGGGGAIPTDQAEWFVSRATHPPIAPTSPPLHPSPIVVFLTVDALRADVVKDKRQAATKNLRELGRKGAVFSHARSPASATSPSIGALFTGKYYSSLYWTPQKEGGKVKYYLPEEPTPRWPALLAERHVHRVMVRRRGGFGPEQGLVGGMDEYSPKVQWADEIVDLVEKSLKAAGPEPMLVYAHMMDPHYPYDSRGKAKKPFDAYLAEVTFVDEQIARLRTIIREMELEDRTFLIISADHGEAFGEHGSKFHASTIYEELVRIPLIVVGPGVKARVIDELVSLIDVGPTILDLFGVSTPGAFMGQSLVPLLEGKDVELTRPLILDTGRRKQAIVGRDGLKIIRNLKEGTVELYDLNVDPGELVNLADERPTVAQARLGTLAAFFDAHELRMEGYEIPSRD